MLSEAQVRALTSIAKDKVFHDFRSHQFRSESGPRLRQMAVIELMEKGLTEMIDGKLFCTERGLQALATIRMSRREDG